MSGVRDGGGMMGREMVRSLLHDVMRRSQAQQTEVVFTRDRTALTRFADGYIHQNVVDETPTLTVRAVYGRRVGAASTTRLDDASLTRVCEQAESLARSASADEEFQGLPGPDGVPDEARYSPATMESTPRDRATAAGVACRIAAEAGLRASGSVTTVGQEIAVANTLGVFAYTPRSVARVVVVATGESGSGRDEEHALDMSALDAESLARRAVDIGRRAQNPIAVPPGDYAVVLQPQAVSDIAGFIAVLGFGAQAVYEGRSFAAGKQGEHVLGENVTLWDDGCDPTGLPLPFDFEGLPRQRLSLVERGVVGDIALDSFYASRMGRRSNGHAVPAAADWYVGPVPEHVFLAPGTAAVDDLIRSTERGLLVTRFNYTRVVHRLHVIVTGMTRDGTFLIENGAVTRPVKNLRFTQSYLAALRDVQAIGHETRLVGDRRIARVPTLKIGAFTFTGATQ